MSDLQTAFDTLLNEQRELQKKFQAQGQALFKETFKEFFDNNPGIKAVVWTQYTPYFNDGDECVFRVNSPTFTNAEDEDLDEILRQCRKNNPLLGVTGLLCVTDNLFIQVLEGGRDEVCDLYNAIVRDERHRHQAPGS